MRIVQDAQATVAACGQVDSDARAEGKLDSVLSEFVHMGGDGAVPVWLRVTTKGDADCVADYWRRMGDPGAFSAQLSVLGAAKPEQIMDLARLSVVVSATYNPQVNPPPPPP
jgi:hypothetical protein